MHNLYAIFAKLLNICKQIAGNLGSTYLTESDDLGNVIKAIMDLSKIDWFKKSVRDIRGYKVENWSDFTDIVKNA